MSVRDPSNVGNILLDLGVVTMEHLQGAVLTQMERRENLLGEILIQTGAISQEQLEYALKIQKELRAGNKLSAKFLVLEYQTRRWDQSVSRQAGLLHGALLKTA